MEVSNEAPAVPIIWPDLQRWLWRGGQREGDMETSSGQQVSHARESKKGKDHSPSKFFLFHGVKVKHV